MDDLEKWKLLTIAGPEFLPLVCPAHSQSLYRLHSRTYEHSTDFVEIMVGGKLICGLPNTAV
jgi:hypothetical protein